MSNKLQELTDKLYNEGLSKGKAEGERILDDARKEAVGLIENARNEAAAIVAEAQKKAEDLKSKTESDVRMASQQSIQTIKKEIENIVVEKIVSPVPEALGNAAFLKEIIQAVAARFSAQESCDLSLVLPEPLKEELGPWVSGALAEAIGKEVKATFSKKIRGGFTIGPKDGSYFVDMTEESFRGLISDYLRPVTRNLLFGE